MKIYGNQVDLTLTTHINNFFPKRTLKPGDKIYISKYSSISSLLFSRIKGDLIRVTSPDKADYIVSDINYDYKNWDYYEDDEVFYVVKKPYYNYIFFVEENTDKLLDSRILLKYINAKQENPDEDTLNSIYTLFSSSDIESVKLGLDLYKYYNMNPYRSGVLYHLCKTKDWGIIKFAFSDKYFKLSLEVQNNKSKPSIYRISSDIPYCLHTIIKHFNLDHLFSDCREWIKQYIKEKYPQCECIDKQYYTYNSMERTPYSLTLFGFKLIELEKYDS